MLFSRVPMKRGKVPTIPWAFQPTITCIISHPKRTAIQALLGFPLSLEIPGPARMQKMKSQKTLSYARASSRYLLAITRWRIILALMFLYLAHKASVSTKASSRETLRQTAMTLQTLSKKSRITVKSLLDCDLA